MISLCMPYWQRQPELDRSLAAYRRVYGDRLALEVSIADDGSPAPVRAPECIVTTLPAKNVGLNPCVPINAAVRASSADVIVLTNPEIEHREDVLTGRRFVDEIALCGAPIEDHGAGGDEAALDRCVNHCIDGDRLHKKAPAVRPGRCDCDGLDQKVMLADKRYSRGTW